MIPTNEIRRRARQLGIDDDQVRHDYVLCHLLAAMSTVRGVVFRGGTALARVYWPDYRLSEDLDFITQLQAEAMKRRISRAVGLAQESSGITMKVDLEGASRLRGVVSASDAEVLIDVVRTTATQAPTKQSLDLPYSNLPKNLSISTVRLEEILADKWFMLEDRDEPRDLFDLRTAITQKRVPFESIAKAHKEKFGYPPMPRTLDRAKRLSRLWEIRLGHQIADLPPLDVVLAELKKALQG